MRLPRFTNDLDFHMTGPTSKIVVLDSPLIWKDPLRTIVVPQGFECDLASVPRILQIPYLTLTWRQSARAGVAHDYLYRGHGYFHKTAAAHPGIQLKLSRKTCDELFYEMLLSDGADRIRASAYYYFVRAGGWKPWRRYGRILGD